MVVESGEALKYDPFKVEEQKGEIKRMTAQQNIYRANVEKARNNRAVELETNRSNLARERETNRSNLANESIAQGNLDEVRRSNLAREDWNNRSLEETSKHNRAQENLGDAQLDELVRSNKAKERLSLKEQAEKQRSNRAQEALQSKGIKSTAKSARYTADSNRAASKYSADSSNEASHYASDSNIKSTKLSNNTKKQIDKAQRELQHWKTVEEIDSANWRAEQAEATKRQRNSIDKAIGEGNISAKDRETLAKVDIAYANLERALTRDNQDAIFSAIDDVISALRLLKGGKK